MKSNGYLVQVTMYGVVAASIVAGLWWLEHQRRERVAAEQPVPRLLRERELARGTSKPHEYLSDEIVRVTDYAAAKKTDNNWIVVAPDTLLQVVRTRMLNDEPWISVKSANTLPTPRLASGTLAVGEVTEAHSSFFERWNPTTVDGLLEVAGYKLYETSFMGAKGIIVRGLLRNTGSAEIRECVVTAKFIDGKDRSFAERQSRAINIRAGEILEFKTNPLSAKFERLMLVVVFTDSEGKRHESDEIPLLAIPRAE